MGALESPPPLPPPRMKPWQDLSTGYQWTSHFTSLTILTVRPVAFFERIPGCTPTISATLSSSAPRLVS